MPPTHGRPAPLVCLVGTVAWTWVLLGAAALTGRPWLSFPTVLLTLPGLVGPIVVPSALIAAGRWDESLEAFWRRSLDPRTLPMRWYAISLALLVVLVVAPVLLSPDADLRLSVGPAAFLVVGVVAGAAEEPGWRGYGQEALQRRVPVLAASLVVGVFWALWHLPMFFLDGTYQHGLGVGTTAFWSFHLALVVGSPIAAWLYNVSGRVVFSVVWFHALGNLGNELLAEDDDGVALLVATVVAAALVATGWAWMRRTVPSRRDGDVPGTTAQTR